MSNYQNMINYLSDKIINNEFKYSDTIIIGDNSIGKSDLLKMVVEKNNDEKIYYLDMVNRRFSDQKVEFKRKQSELQIIALSKF